MGQWITAGLSLTQGLGFDLEARLNVPPLAKLGEGLLGLDFVPALH